LPGANGRLGRYSFGAALTGLTSKTFALQLRCHLRGQTGQGNVNQVEQIVSALQHNCISMMPNSIVSTGSEHLELNHLGIWGIRRCPQSTRLAMRRTASCKAQHKLYRRAASTAKFTSCDCAPTCLLKPEYLSNDDSLTRLYSYTVTTPNLCVGDDD